MENRNESLQGHISDKWCFEFGKSIDRNVGDGAWALSVFEPNDRHLAQYWFFAHRLSAEDLANEIETILNNDLKRLARGDWNESDSARVADEIFNLFGARKMSETRTSTDTSAIGEPKRYKIKPTVGRAVRFRGARVAFGSSSDNSASPYFSGWVGRSDSAAIYRTTGGDFVLRISSFTRWDGESDTVEVWKFSSLKAALDVVTEECSGQTAKEVSNALDGCDLLIEVTPHA